MKTNKDLIDRQAAIDALWKALYEYEDKTEKQFIESDELDVTDWIHHRIFVQNMSDIDRQTILNLPSAQPVPEEFEWCHDCKEYDQEAHCCHRWTKVIRQTVKELREGQTEAHWIPCSERLPKDRLYVLVTYKYEYGLIDNGITWYSETESKWNTSREVIAWMPLPAPYRKDGD